MDYISVKKLSEKYKIDFYQFISYLEFLNIPIEIENNIKCVFNENIPIIDKFISTYTTNQIRYIKLHNIKNFYIKSARKIPPFRVVIWIAEIILAIITINYYNKVKITKN